MKVSELRKLIKEVIQEEESLTLKAGDKVRIVVNEIRGMLYKLEVNDERVSFRDFNKALDKLGIDKKLHLNPSPMSNGIRDLEDLIAALNSKGMNADYFEKDLS